MRKVANYLNFKKEIVENLHYMTETQQKYMSMYLVNGLDTYQIAQACGKEHTTISRTLQRGWSRMRLIVKSPREVEAVFTFNANGDIIGMEARTAVRGKRGRLKTRKGAEPC